MHRIGRTGRAGKKGKSITFFNHSYDVPCSAALVKVAEDKATHADSTLSPQLQQTHHAGMNLVHGHAADDAQQHSPTTKKKGSQEKAVVNTVTYMVSRPEPRTIEQLMTDVNADDVAAKRCDSVGVIDAELFNELGTIADADYYICGPKPFMAHVLHHLRQRGIDESRLHVEFFGPKIELEVPVAVAG